MDAIRELERLNVEICKVAGAGQGHATRQEALARYDDELFRRREEVRAAILACRKGGRRFHGAAYVDGIEAALERAEAKRDA